MRRKIKSERIITFEAMSRRRAAAFAACAERSDEWAPADITSKRGGLYQDSTVRKGEIAPIGAVPSLASIWKGEITAAALEIAVAHHGVSNLVETDAEILRYHPGDFFGPHRDSPLSGALSDRVFTLILYLNDDFVGGRTIFHDLDHYETPVAGMCVMFDSTLVHSGELIQTGNKLAVIGCLSRPMVATTKVKNNAATQYAA